MYISIDCITYSTYIPSLNTMLLLFSFKDNDLIAGAMILVLRSDIPAWRLTGLLYIHSDFLANIVS
jgi:hypothetical protein